MIVADAFEQRLDVRVDRVIAANGDAVASAVRDLLAASSIVPGTPSVVGPLPALRPVTYTVAPAAPSSRAMPRPAPRLAPVTSATTLFSCGMSEEQSGLKAEG